MGVAFDRIGHSAEAVASYRQALRLRPDYADAHLDLGLALLSMGDFTAGWEEYEWRWRTRRVMRRDFAQPQWDGSPLNGRTLLIHAEQGLGDTVQFLRYVPLVRDAVIILEVPPALARLVEGLDGVKQVIPAGAALPGFDLHAPLLSLPRLFRTTPETIPNRTPYLQFNDPARTRLWNTRTGQPGAFRVGIAWAGSAANSNNRTRSMRLADLAPLGDTPGGVSFFSLQKGPAVQERAPARLAITDLLADTHDVRDTAALVLNMDLIISVDTFVAHLAGALGKPVWTLLSFAADWRWLRARDDCPWYPQMRLFRQSYPGDWQPVVERVVHTLTENHSCHPSTP
jgi:hypothetical protein